MNTAKRVFKAVFGKWLFTGIIFFALLSTGMAITYDFDGYRKVTGDRFGIKYSFEYPASYVDRTQITYYTPSEGSGYALIFCAFRTNYVKYGHKIITIDTFESYPNAEAAVEGRLNYLNNIKTYPDDKFLLKERYETKIADIRGTAVAYSISDYDSNYVESTNIVREVYFSYKERIWNISIESPEELADEAEKDFEHILETFQFVN